MANHTCLKASKRARGALLALLLLPAPALLAAGGPGRVVDPDSGSTARAGHGEASAPPSSWSFSNLPRLSTVLKGVVLCFLAVTANPVMVAEAAPEPAPAMAQTGMESDLSALALATEINDRAFQVLGDMSSRLEKVPEQYRELVTQQRDYFFLRTQQLEEIIGISEELSALKGDDPAREEMRVERDRLAYGYKHSRVPFWHRIYSNIEEMQVAFHSQPEATKPKHALDADDLYGCWERIEHPLDSQRTLYQVTPEGVQIIRITRDGDLQRTCVLGQVTALLEYPKGAVGEAGEGRPGPARATLSIDGPGGRVTLPFLLFQVSMGGCGQAILLEQGGAENLYLKTS